jgi:hypothetical protein
MKKIIIVISFIIGVTQIVFSVTKLFLDTYYRMSYDNYSNLDFDFSTSTDDITKIYSDFNLELKTQIDNFEFKTGLCSLGEFGKIVSSSTKQYSWQKNIPYPNTEFLPWLTECYTKYKYVVDTFTIPYIKFSVENILLDITFGRQRKEFVEGLIVGDNKIGYDGISADFVFGKYFYINSLVSRINSVAGFQNNTKFDLYSFLLGSKFYSGYDFGMNYVVENDEIKNSEKIYYEFFVKQEQENFDYIFEYIMQKGKKLSTEENYSGSLLYFRGKVKGKNRFLGESTAGMVWLLSSGGGETSVFSPTFTKMYDYTELYGFGEFTKANSKTIFFDLPDGYSGVFVLGLDLNVNPVKKLYCGLEYYLFSSPEAPDDKPDPSSTEKTLGAKKAVGLEYGLSAKYKISELVITKFSYSIFNPVKNAFSDKPKGDNATKISFSVETKF